MNTQTDGQTDRWTNRQTDILTWRKHRPQSIGPEGRCFEKWSHSKKTLYCIVSGRLLDSKVLCWQLRGILHQKPILHHGHHPPWLGICFRKGGRQSTKVNRPLDCGLFLLNPTRCWIVRPYANSSELSYTPTLSYTADTILPGLEYAMVKTELTTVATGPYHVHCLMWHSLLTDPV